MLPFFVIGTLILCLLTLAPGIGVEKKGASRWIKVPFVGTLQPSELAKFAVILFLANLFDKYNASDSELEKNKDYFYPLTGLLVFVLVIILQKDLSTGLFIFVIGVALFVISGARLSWLIPFCVLAIPAACLLIAIQPYRLNRVVAFLKPEEFQLTTGFQRFASRRAISAGGLWGNGMGTGMNYVTSIPEGLFRGNIKATSIAGTFKQTGITSIPTNLLKYNLLLTNLQNAFNTNNKNITDFSLYLPATEVTNLGYFVYRTGSNGGTEAATRILYVPTGSTTASTASSEGTTNITATEYTPDMNEFYTHVYNLIQDGVLTITDVPSQWQEGVQAIIDANNP